MDIPFFSVILITYNRADLLPRCIESVLQQTFDSWELIIVDNYSEDRTKELVNDYMSNDSRIKFLQVHNNDILAISRNTGIKAAQGKYICFLDSDDWFHYTKLEKCFNVANEKDYDVLYSRYRLMSSKGRGRICGRALKWDNKFYELLIVGSIICNSTAVVKKEAIEFVGYLSEDPGFRAVEDLDLWLRLAKSNKTFYYIDDCLCYYWLGNNMSFSPKQITQLSNVYEKYLPLVEESQKRDCITCRDYSFGRLYHKIGDFDKAISYYISVIPYQRMPNRLKSVILITLAKLKIHY